MSDHYFTFQTPPKTGGKSETTAGKLLSDAAGHLTRSARFLSGDASDHASAAGAALRAVRQSFAALLAFHGRNTSEAMSLTEMALQAESLDSSLRTYYRRALPLAALDAGIGISPPLSLEQREEAEAGFYTARNALAVVIAAMPERLTGDAILLLNRAQAIRTGRVSPTDGDRAFRMEQNSSRNNPARREPSVAA